MCKFCNNEPRAIIQSIKQKPDVMIVTAGIECGNTLKVIGTLQSSHFVGVIPLESETKIFYCPMCGRKLVCNMYEHCCNEYKQIIDDREKDSILYISDSEKDIRIFLEYLKNKMDNNGKECFLDGEHDILKTKNYNVVCKSIYGTQLGIGYGYCLHYCFSRNFDKSKCNDMKKYSIAEILAHTREGAKEISELDILYMYGLV